MVGDRLDVCIIGVGRMGQRHVAAARGAGFRIVGICDASTKTLASAGDECDIDVALRFTDVATMLAVAQPDAVVVSTTAPSHCELICAAVKGGAKYVVCEKPMAVSLAQCDRMIAECRAAGAKLAVNHQMRFMEQYAGIKAMVNTPEFGGLRSMMVSAGNFGLAMNGSHYFEAFRFLTGEPLTEISAWFDPGDVPNPRGPQFIDRSGQLRGVSASGVRILMEFGGDLGHGVRVVYGCRTGQIVVDELVGNVNASYRQSEYREFPTTRYGMPADELSRKIVQAEVVAPTVALWQSMLADGAYPDGDSGLHAVAALVAANLSGESGGRVVSIGSGLPRERIFAWA